MIESFGIIKIIPYRYSIFKERENIYVEKAFG